MRQSPSIEYHECLITATRLFSYGKSGFETVSKFLSQAQIRPNIIEIRELPFDQNASIGILVFDTDGLISQKNESSTYQRIAP